MGTKPWRLPPQLCCSTDSWPGRTEPRTAKGAWRYDMSIMARVLQNETERCRPGLRPGPRPTRRLARALTLRARPRAGGPFCAAIAPRFTRISPHCHRSHHYGEIDVISINGSSVMSSTPLRSMTPLMHQMLSSSGSHRVCETSHTRWAARVRRVLSARRAR